MLSYKSMKAMSWHQVAVHVVVQEQEAPSMSDTPIGNNVDIRISSQNVYRKYDWTNPVLVSHNDKSCKFKFDIFFLQEPPWSEIKCTASMKDKQGNSEMGMPRHPDWKCIQPKVTSVENVTQSHDSSCPCVTAYVHCHLWAMKPKLCMDIFNHKDIMLITLNSPNGKINLVNAYSDSSGSAIRILHDSDIPFLSYLGGNFNCPSEHWDENVIHSNPFTNSLSEFTEEHGLDFRTGGIGAIHYPRNGSRPSIIDLVFLPIGNQDSVVHCGNLGESDHQPINTFIRFSILEETLPPRIKKGSEEESGFLSDLVDFEAILHKGSPCLTTEDTWNAFRSEERRVGKECA